jgi:hypothetical protein
MKNPPTTSVHDLASRLGCRKKRQGGPTSGGDPRDLRATYTDHRAATIGSRRELESASDQLKAIFPTKKAIRLLGVSISGFVDAQNDSPAQISLL